MFDIIPSHLQGQSYNSGNAFDSNSLLIGEVQAIYHPADPQNVSRRTTEYDVFVALRMNGTGVTKIYKNVCVIDGFGSIADSFTHTLRADTAAKRTDSSKKVGPGLGSKVLMLCINGEPHNSMIIGGVRDSGLPPETDLGHNLAFRFNGVNVEINDAGELLLDVHGKTDNTGKTVADDMGASIKITSDGNVSITAKNDVIVNSPRVQLGSDGASEPAVKGDSWKTMMTQLLSGLQALTVLTPIGTSSPPVNLAVFAQLQAQLQQQLSDKVFVE